MLIGKIISIEIVNTTKMRFISEICEFYSVYFLREIMRERKKNLDIVLSYHQIFDIAKCMLTND